MWDHIESLNHGFGPLLTIMFQNRQICAMWTKSHLAIPRGINPSTSLGIKVMTILGHVCLRFYEDLIFFK